METFRKMNIRLIAINDNVDRFRGGVNSTSVTIFFFVSAYLTIVQCGQGAIFGQINGKSFQINVKKNLNMSINGQEVPFPTLVSNYNAVKYLLTLSYHDIFRFLKRDKIIAQIIEIINRRRTYE